MTLQLRDLVDQSQLLTLEYPPHVPMYGNRPTLNRTGPQNKNTFLNHMDILNKNHVGPIQAQRLTQNGSGWWDRVGVHVKGVWGSWHPIPIAPVAPFPLSHVATSRNLSALLINRHVSVHQIIEIEDVNPRVVKALLVGPTGGDQFHLPTGRSWEGMRKRYITLFVCINAFKHFFFFFFWVSAGYNIKKLHFVKYAMRKYTMDLHFELL